MLLAASPCRIRRCSANRPQRPDIGTAGGREYQMIDLAKRFIKDEPGATAIEYGLIAAGISVAIIVVVNSLGSQLKTTFTKVTSQLATAGSR
jgi:pilus assembly protein Flp/PilA